MANLATFIAQKRRWHSFDASDLNQGANAVILAMDGKVARSDALMIARMVFESMGMEKRA